MKFSNMKNNRSIIFFFTMQTIIAVILIIVCSTSPSFADTTQYAGIQAYWSISPAISDTFYRPYDHVSPYMSYSYDHIAGGPYESSSAYVPYPGGSGSYGDKITATNSSGVTSSNGVSTFAVNRDGVGDFRSGDVTLEATTTAIVPSSGSIYEEYTYDASVINIYVHYALYGMTGGLYDPTQPAPYWDLTVSYNTISSFTHTGSASYWPRNPRYEIFGKYRIWEEDETTGSLIGQEWQSSYLFGASLTGSPLVFPLNPFDPDFQSVINYWGEPNPMIANPERGILELVVLVSSEANEYRQNQEPGAVPEPASVLLLVLGLM